MRAPTSLILVIIAAVFAWLAYVLDVGDDRFNHTLMAVAIAYVVAALFLRFTEWKGGRR